ncbi:MAG TPA: UDP-N-acetylmuramate dehydrogenase [Terriglobales bacterium]|jgi:UDP-N-acetylmuramate dehydrogenase|nr:UDP-N-acetylmuramate dehydrogenase [Terriglobales bacterium]
MQIQQQVPLAPLTTFKVGGPARYFAEARREEDVRAAVAEARSREWPLFVLGGGSNLVISDAGWPGLVLKIALKGIAERRVGSRMLFEAAAGEDWDGFVAHAVARDCAGIECLSGIPGTVGGTPVQNVGAYGQEVSETITTVRALDTASGEIRELENADSGFAYRTSIFNARERGRYIVLRVTFALTPRGVPHLEYTDLKRHFAGRSNSPTLAETREAVRAIRLSKAMLIVPGDDDCRSAGSFFKNPVLTREAFEQLQMRAGPVPNFPTKDGSIKVAAAWLVEHAGFHKGLARGRVGISRRHALAIINRGGATAADIIALKNEIQQRVLDQFGIELQPEPVFVGFDQKP